MIDGEACAAALGASGRGTATWHAADPMTRAATAARGVLATRVRRADSLEGGVPPPDRGVLATLVRRADSLEGGVPPSG